MLEKHSFFERNNFKKRRFKELYGRKPTKAEIKLLRKDLIDLKASVVHTTNKNNIPINERIAVKQSGGIAHDV